MTSDEDGSSAPDYAEIAIHPPVLWLVVAVSAIGLDALWPLPILADSPARPWLACILLGTGIAIAAFTVYQFWRARIDVRPDTPTTAIIETGFYKVSRNPIYVALHLVLAGLAFAYGSVWLLIALVPFHLVLHHGVVLREEAYLGRKFGQPYLDYKARVRRWI